MQLAFDPAQQVHALTIRIERSIEDHSGSFTVEVTSDSGALLGRDRIAWRKPHDLSALQFVAKKVVDAYMWTTPSEILLAFRVAFKEHVAALDLDAQGELKMLGNMVPIKRKGNR